MTEVEFKSLGELLPEELLRVLRIRQDVFVIEQDCIYPDIDDVDISATHVLLKSQGQIIGTARVYADRKRERTVHVGRVAVDREHRRLGYAHCMMQKISDLLRNSGVWDMVEISAQSYLLKFYEQHGFHKVGEEYLEDGIPHYKMISTFPPNLTGKLHHQ